MPETKESTSMDIGTLIYSSPLKPRDVAYALRMAREGDYSVLRKYFEMDHEVTSIYVARNACEFPSLLNLKEDIHPEGFLENIANNAISGHPNEEEVKEELAKSLSVVSVYEGDNNSAKLKEFGERALYLFVAVLNGPFLFREGELVEAVSRKFSKKREEKYRKVLGIN